ncbi:MAG: hypothetical protein GY816_24180 [Cytophagales bacterium]|nr:hypothetical protein [Cytophagales bacterium]
MTWTYRTKWVLFIVLSFPIFVSAATVNWIGDVSSGWNDPNNWAGNTLFANGDDVVIDPANYTNAPVIGSNSTNSPGDITV